MNKIVSYINYLYKNSNIFRNHHKNQQKNFIFLKTFLILHSFFIPHSSVHNKITRRYKRKSMGWDKIQAVLGSKTVE